MRLLMDDIQAKSFQTPIEIVLGIDGDGMTTAKKLYDFLGMDRSHYSRWVKSNISGNQFAEENVDYWAFATDGERDFNPNPTQDYKLTAHFAKKLSMMQKNERGEQAREYFTQLEERVKQKVIDRSQLSPHMQMFYALADQQAEMELEQKRQSERINRIEQKQETIIETFTTNADDENFRDWANRCIGRIAESPKFDKGIGRLEKSA